jgi:hypothetical protein
VAYAAEQVESRFAPWVAGLMVGAGVLAGLTIVLTLSAGNVGKAFPVGVASFVLAVAARILAQVVGAHRSGATVILVLSFVALGAGLQSFFIGAGQV